jgi:putative FmdB family regulatory protein
MPIYEYICQDCGKRYDKFVRASTSKIALKCPKCGSDQGKKAFSAFSTPGSSGLSSSGSFSNAPACGPVG